MVRRSRLLLTLSLLLATVPLAAWAAPTPIPGGANQTQGVSGKTGETVWNGVVRLKIAELRDATPGDAPESLLPQANQKVLVMTGTVRNGTSTPFMELLSFTLADADDVTFEIPSHLFKSGAPLNIAPAAAAKVSALFPVDKDYVPTKLIVTCPTCNSATHFKAFRITLTR